MKRIRIVGLCLVAGLALSAMGASDAQAGELRRCLNAIPAHKGNWTNKSCTQRNVTHSGKYEWVSGVGTAGEPATSAPGPYPVGKWKYHSASKRVVLESTQGDVACKKEQRRR